MNDTFNLINKHKESLNDFYSEACYIHGVRFLRTTINNSAHNPIGNVVEVITEKGDKWSVSDEDAEPTVKFEYPNAKKKIVTMRTKTKYYTDYKFEVKEKSDGTLIFNDDEFKNEDELLKHLKEVTNPQSLMDVLSLKIKTWRSLNSSETDEEETILSFNVSDIK